MQIYSLFFKLKNLYKIESIKLGTKYENIGRFSQVPISSLLFNF